MENSPWENGKNLFTRKTKLSRIKIHTIDTSNASLCHNFLMKATLRLHTKRCRKIFSLEFPWCKLLLIEKSLGAITPLNIPIPGKWEGDVKVVQFTSSRIKKSCMLFVHLLRESKILPAFVHKNGKFSAKKVNTTLESRTYI